MIECRACKQSLPESDFRIHKRGYRIGKCKPCERLYQRERVLRDPELHRKRKRESMAQRRAADPEAARAKRRIWHAANIEQRRAKQSAYASTRFFWTRTFKLCRGERPTAKQLASLWHIQRGRCALSGVKLDRTAQLDHIVPRARGGSDLIGNLQWVTAAVNYAKRDLGQDEFINLCRDVAAANGSPDVAWIGRRFAMVEQMEVLKVTA